MGSVNRLIFNYNLPYVCVLFTPAKLQSSGSSQKLNCWLSLTQMFSQWRMSPSCSPLGRRYSLNGPLDSSEFGSHTWKTKSMQHTDLNSLIALPSGNNPVSGESSHFFLFIYLRLCLSLPDLCVDTTFSSKKTQRSPSGLFHVKSPISETKLRIVHFQQFLRIVQENLQKKNIKFLKC